MLSSGDLGNNPFSYEYGPDNLRYKKTVNGVETYYYWDGNLLVGEKTGTDFYRYFYDASGIIGMKYNSNYYYFEKDILGNILRAYDTNGTIVASFNYDSFGNFNASGSMVNLVKFRYRGYYYDAETGFYYLQNRYYDPTIFRFISADKSSLLSTLANSIGELNLYVYCNNNPIMHTDPTGEIDWEKIGGWILVLTVAVFATSAIAVVGLGLILTNTVVASVLVGAGVGYFAGVTGSIVVQGGLNNIADIDPYSVLFSGLIGAGIGAVSGATSFTFSKIGEALGESLGYILSNATHIGSGINFAKAFGISTSMLSALGSAIGGMIGGSLAGTLTNNFANKFVTQTFGEKYTVDNPNYLRSALLNFFKWLNPY